MAPKKKPPKAAKGTAATSSPAGGVAKPTSSSPAKRKSSPRKTEDVRLRDEAESFTRRDLGSFNDEVDVPGSRRSKRVRQAPRPVYEPEPLPVKKKATPTKKKTKITEPVEESEEVEEEEVVVPVKAKFKRPETPKKTAKKPVKKPVKKPAKKPAKKREVIVIPDEPSEVEDEDNCEVVLVEPKAPKELVDYTNQDPGATLSPQGNEKLFNNKEKDQAAKWKKIVQKLDNIEETLNGFIGMEPPKIAEPKKAAPTTPENKVKNPLRMTPATPGSGSRKRLHDDDGKSPGAKRAKKVKAAKEDAEEVGIPQLDGGLLEYEEEEEDPEADFDVDSDPEAETAAEKVMEVFNGRHPKGNKTGQSTTPEAVVYEPLRPRVNFEDQEAAYSDPGIVDTIADAIKLAMLFNHRENLWWNWYADCEGDDQDRDTRKMWKSKINAVECQSFEYYAMAAWLRANYQWQHPGWDADDDGVNNATNPSRGRKKSKAGAKPKLGKRELSKLARFAKERYLAYIGRSLKLQRMAEKRSVITY